MQWQSFIYPFIQNVFIEHLLCARQVGKMCALMELTLWNLQYFGGSKIHFHEAVECVQQKKM